MRFSTRCLWRGQGPVARLSLTVAICLAALLAGCSTGRAPTGRGASPGQSTVASLLANADTRVSTSGIVKWPDGYWFAWDRQTASGAIVTSIYNWQGGHWRLRADLTIESKGNVINHGGIDPAQAITVASLTGTGYPDFLIHSGGADTYWLNVISRIAGRWQTVNFDDGAGATLAEDEISVKGHIVVVGYNNCQPTCAQGHVTKTGFQYQDGLFAPVAPPGSCAGERLATAARLGPFGRAPYGTWGITSYACADGYAMAVALVNADQTLTFRAAQGAPGWVEIANTMGGPQRYIPLRIARKIIKTLQAGPQDLYYPY